MKSINEVTLTGALVGNVKTTFINDKQVISFTLETCESLFNATDEVTRFYAELHTIIVFGALAKYLVKVLSPGMQIYVRGKKKRTDRDGQVTEVVVENGGIAVQVGTLASEKYSGIIQKNELESLPTVLSQQSAYPMTLCIKDSPRVAVLSTGHVTEEDSEIMSGLCWNSETEEGKYWIQTAPGGWILRICNCEIWEHELTSSGISYYAMHNLRMLEKSGYGWFHLDASAQIIEGLNLWDW